MKIINLISLILILNINTNAQKSSIGLEIGHARFVDTWVSGVNTEVYYSYDIIKHISAYVGIGRSSGFNTGFSPQENSSSAFRSYYANTNNRAYFGLGLNLINNKHHLLSVIPKIGITQHKYLNDFQTEQINGVVYRKEPYFYNETVRTGSIAFKYAYKFKKLELGTSVEFIRYGDFTQRNKNLILAFRF